MISFWTIFLILFIIACIGFIVFILQSSDEGTTEITTGNFSSLIGNEIIQENINLKNYIIEAQTKVSQIIVEDIEIPLTIRRYPLGEGILAQAKMYNKYNVRAGGVIIINTVRLEDPSRWVNIIVHEIFHVLGVGTSDKWDDSTVRIGNENYLDRSLFPKSARKYDELINNGLISGNVGHPIPLSDACDSYPDGGAHLDEIIFDNEVMTPIADKVNVISSLSIAMLEDLGFEVDYDVNEDYLL
jgi:hypothetical protein